MQDVFAELTQVLSLANYPDHPTPFPEKLHQLQGEARQLEHLLHAFKQELREQNSTFSSPQVHLDYASISDSSYSSDRINEFFELTHFAYTQAIDQKRLTNMARVTSCQKAKRVL
jgi:hypothetical protein